MAHIWGDKRVITPSIGTIDKRTSERRALTLPARLAWTDQRGINRFASVVTRDVSDSGVFVESQSALSIPLYRLVHFQVEPTVLRASNDLPESLRQGRILSAVYRVSHAGKHSRHGVALRLMVAPKRQLAESVEEARVSA
jgi:hypothetical protein